MINYKKSIFFLLVIAVCAVSAYPHQAFSQQAQQEASQDEGAANAVQEMQRMDPAAVQGLTNAIQQGNTQAVKKIYENFQKNQPASQTTTSFQPVAVEPLKPSLFERVLSSNITTTPRSINQFGYELFNKTVSTFAVPPTMPVGPDYIIGPGDQFTMTLWGTTEGIYTLKVSKEGSVTLPKVGVVSLAGIRFGELEATLKRHLSRYYNDFNLSIAMGGLKTQTIYVVGEVVKPGSYSLSSLTTVYGALFVAGGPTKQGTLRSIQVLRSGKVIKTLDLYEFLLKGDRSQDIKLQNEDTVFVPLIGPVAAIAGAVYRPAIYELKGQESIDDCLKLAGGILPTALGHRLQLTRYEQNLKKTIVDISVENTAGAPQGTTEFREKVRNMDTITVRPVYDKIWEIVTLAGAVQHPGDFQWRADLRVKEIIDQGMPLPTADLTRAEIIRLNKDFSDREIVVLDLAALMKGDQKQNTLLQPHDEVKVYSRFQKTESVVVIGEVVRPGTYDVMSGERLSDLMRRVGGMTAEGYPYGAVFKRKTVKASETKNLKAYAAKMQSQILLNAAGSAATALNTEEASFAKTEMALNQSLLSNLTSLQEQNEGRVAINITSDYENWAGSKDDLILQDGDSLLIPKKPQEVLIFGEVYTPGAQVFQPDLSVKDYLERTGGTTRYADSDQIFIVQANGFAFGVDSPNVGKIEKATLKAGDAIFVPQKMERYATMRMVKDIIDILFKTAVIFATIHVIL